MHSPQFTGEAESHKRGLVKTHPQETYGLRSHPGSANHELCDFGQVIQHLCVSVTRITGVNKSTYSHDWFGELNELICIKHLECL